MLPGHRGRVTAEKMPQCETRNSLGNPEKLLVSQLLCPCEIPMKNSFPGRGHSQLNCHVSYMKVCLFLSLLIEIRSPLCYSELLSRSVSPASAPWIAETTFSPACPAVSEVSKGPSTLTWNTEENAENVAFTPHLSRLSVVLSNWPWSWNLQGRKGCHTWYSS